MDCDHEDQLGDVQITKRGQQCIEFLDRFGSKCELIAIGKDSVEFNTTKQDVFLMYDQVQALIGHLLNWTETGYFDQGAED